MSIIVCALLDKVQLSKARSSLSNSLICTKYELKRTETSKDVCVCMYKRALRKTSTNASVQVLEQFTLEDVRKLGRQASDVSPFVVSRLNIHTTVTFSRITH